VVLRSDPGNGRELRRDTPVDLVVSRGPEPIEVPDLTGRAADRAEQRLTGLGLEVSTSSENSDSVPKGRVITQSPSTGTLYRGDAVSLTVSEGPVLVEVPNVRAVGVAQATERLEELGFEVVTAESSTYLGLGFVSSADPDFGTMAPRGSTITLYLV
jgi:beta-lactam-binding protein with PASTA domain